MSPNAWYLGSGSFDMHTARVSETQGLGTFCLSSSSNLSLEVSGMNCKFEKLLQKRLPLESLFIHPVVLPDVTCLSPLPLPSRWIRSCNWYSINGPRVISH